MKIKSIILLSILCLNLKTQAQNLVLNSSFEQHTSCPNASSQINYCSNWNNGGVSSTCDYFSAFNCSGNFSPPIINYTSYLQVFEQPLSGQSFAGFIPYLSGGSLREFLQGKFNTPLVNGKNYYVEFYINAIGQQKYFIHDIAALITDTAGLLDPNNPQLYSPQIQPKAGIIYKDTINWMRINGYYSALGGEQYITIGNYTPHGLELKDSVVSQYLYADYFIDSVGVYEVTSWDAWNAGSDKTINSGDSVQIGNPCTDYSMFDWITSTNGITYLNDSTKPNVWSKPTVTTTYYVTKTQSSNVFKDTVTVFVNNIGINQFSNSKIKIKLYPNPTNENLQVQYDLRENALLEIIDINGKVVGKYNLSASSTTLNISNDKLENGIYFYRVIENNNFSCMGKIVIIK